jgi:guanine nucleotide-binding protein subunit alpha
MLFPNAIPLLVPLSSSPLPQLLLLGQAESGKSTLQKQFQLMYSPDTLDKERASWRMVIYFNVARSVKRVLEYLDTHGDTFDGDIHDTPYGPVHDSLASKKTIEDLIREDAAEDTSPQGSRSYSSPVPPVLTEAQKQIATLRLRLSPLVAAENTLADRLSCGVRVSGSGRDSVFVRHGWQLRSAARNSYLSSRPRGTSGTPATPMMESGNSGNVSEVVEEVGRILHASKEDIKALWRSDVVQKMIKRRRLRLEEWAELYALIRTSPKFVC